LQIVHAQNIRRAGGLARDERKSGIVRRPTADGAFVPNASSKFGPMLRSGVERLPSKLYMRTRFVSPSLKRYAIEPAGAGGRVGVRATVVVAVTVVVGVTEVVIVADDVRVAVG